MSRRSSNRNRYALALVALRRLQFDLVGLVEGVEHLALDDGLARLVEMHVDLVDAVAKRGALRNLWRHEADRGGLVNDLSERKAIDGRNAGVAVPLDALDAIAERPRRGEMRESSL